MFYVVENIPDEQSMQAVVAELLPLVPFARREQALRYKHLHGQYCCLRAWQLLHSLLRENNFIPASLPLADLTYTVDDYGKPSLSNAVFERSGLSSLSNAVYFSLSHTKTAIAVAIDHAPVGIDVETIVSPARISDRHFLDRTMNPAEQQQIAAADDPCLAFTELWTKKEALVKLLGTGIDMSTLPTLLTALPTLLVPQPAPSPDAPQPYSFLTTRTPSYACTVVTIS